MTELKVGDFVLIKSLGDGGTIVGCPGIIPGFFRVRIPQTTKDGGINFEAEATFCREELETPEERVERQVRLHKFELELRIKLQEELKQIQGRNFSKSDTDSLVN